MRSRAMLITGCALLLVAAVSLVRAEEEPKPADAVKNAADKASAEKTPAPAKKKSTPIALTMEGIRELEERKVALDAREKALEERARDLDLQEKLLKEKLRKMEELNKKMAERLDTYKKDHEAKIVKLVTVVEGMRPEAAARYVEALDPELAVEILARMKEQRASKILNLLDKQKGARLTELYTGYRDSIEEPAAAQPPQASKEGTDTNRPM